MLYFVVFVLLFELMEDMLFKFLLNLFFSLLLMFLMLFLIFWGWFLIFFLKKIVFLGLSLFCLLRNFVCGSLFGLKLFNSFLYDGFWILVLCVIFFKWVKFVMRFVGLVCLFWVDDIWLFGFLDFWWEGRISGGLLEGVGDFFWFEFCLGVLVFVEWFFVFGIVIVLFYGCLFFWMWIFVFYG